MDAKLREERLDKLKTGNPYAYKEMTYKNRTEKLAVFEIPVEYLVFNQYNGRIGTFVKTHEKQYGPIDSSTPEGEKIIVDFLWNSKKNRNKDTLKDIEEKGQLEYGIITKDGVVIDGNRRCMILKMIAEKNKTAPTYFKAVILDDTLDNNPKEIRKLETIYQMGVDEKVDYNAIEKYLKCQDLSKEGFIHDEIGKMMGENGSKIKEYLDILELMEEYLKTYGYEGMYTVLSEEAVEGPFVDLRGYLEAHRAGKGKKDWIPEADDRDDLKLIYFDHIRAGIRTAHDIRNIGNPSKGQGFFNRKKIWVEFSNRYYNEIKPINEDERTLEDWREEHKGEDVDKIILARNRDWLKKAENPMKKNIALTQRSLDDFNESNFPGELLSRAQKTLNAVDTYIESFYSEDIIKQCHDIRKTVERFIDIIKKRDKYE